MWLVNNNHQIYTDMHKYTHTQNIYAYICTYNVCMHVIHTYSKAKTVKHNSHEFEKLFVLYEFLGFHGVKMRIMVSEL
jgi:hypothetical protein